MNITGLLKVIPMAFVGWINVFVVLIAIAAVVGILNKITENRK